MQCKSSRVWHPHWYRPTVFIDGNRVEFGSVQQPLQSRHLDCNKIRLGEGNKLSCVHATRCSHEVNHELSSIRGSVAIFTNALKRFISIF